MHDYERDIKSKSISTYQYFEQIRYANTFVYLLYYKGMHAKLSTHHPFGMAESAWISINFATSNPSIFLNQYWLREQNQISSVIKKYACLYQNIVTKCIRASHFRHKISLSRISHFKIRIRCHISMFCHYHKRLYWDTFLR
jgi:hypothetical protein